uniref:NAD(P)-binding Rossmann-fold superfamily protein n=1 Tax=Tanacetum cinerariifolium TaxID=118510 RepID=A0A6L2NNL1_TANCI|nr:NAD(P)-binding Rossmann-fold superfamily protein [Tanacetum cinerariifolium]
MTSFQNRKKTKINLKTRLKKKVEQSPPWVQNLLSFVELPKTIIILRRLFIFSFMAFWSVMNSADGGLAFQFWNDLSRSSAIKEMVISRMKVLMFSKFEYDGKLNPTFIEGPFELPISSIRAYIAEQPLTLRFVHVGSARVTRPKILRLDLSKQPPAVRLNKELGSILAFKLKGKDLIRENGIPYTIVRPRALTGEPARADLRFEQGHNITKRDGEEIEREREILLLVSIPFLYLGGSKWTEFTKYYVQPSLGESGIGGVIAVYGVVDAICSLAVGRFTSSLSSITLIVSGGAFLQSGILIWLLNYSEPTGVLGVVFPFLIAAVWGIGIGVLVTQLNALLAMLFKHNMRRCPPPLIDTS